MSRPHRFVKRGREAPSSDEHSPSVEDRLDTITALLTAKFSEIDKKFDDLNDKFDDKIDGVTERLRRQEISNAALLTADVRHRLVEDEDHTQAVLSGTVATWTWMRYGHRLFAVGCVHCGLHYRTETTGQVFVALPAGVLKRGVVAVYFTANIDLFPTAGLPTHSDVMAVEVKNNVGVHAADWPTQHHSVLVGQAYGCVYGTSHSSAVSGHGSLAKLPPHKRAAVYVQVEGEPGQSGTLLYGSTLDDPATVLGVYCGVVDASPRKGMKMRARLALVPWLHTMVRYDVRKTRVGSKLHLQDATRRFTARWSMNDHMPGIFDYDFVSGVVINGECVYSGSLDCVSSREGPRS